MPALPALAGYEGSPTTAVVPALDTATELPKQPVEPAPQLVPADGGLITAGSAQLVPENEVTRPRPALPADGSPTSAIEPEFDNATDVPNADGIGLVGTTRSVPAFHEVVWVYTVAAPVSLSPPTGSPTSAIVPVPESATDVPNSPASGGAVNATPEDHTPLVKV